MKRILCVMLAVAMLLLSVAVVNANPPTINEFNINPSSGDQNTCPRMTWAISGNTWAKVFVDGQYVMGNSNSNDEDDLCSWDRTPGQHTFQLLAINGNESSTAYAQYTVNGPVVPVIQQNPPQIVSFTSNTYSGDTNTCPTVTWQSLNSLGQTIYVDGKQVFDVANMANGSQEICEWNKTAGKHDIQLVVTSSTGQQATQQIQYAVTSPVPVVGDAVIDNWSANILSAGANSCPTVEWKTRAAVALSVYVDGQIVDHFDQLSGSKQLCNWNRMIGTHDIALAAQGQNGSIVTKHLTYEVTSEVPVIGGGAQPVPSIGGNTQPVPVIGQADVPTIIVWQPDMYSGSTYQSPTVTFDVSGAATLGIYVDGICAASFSGQASGIKQITNWTHSAGTHTFMLLATSANGHVSTQVFNYTVTAGVPVIGQ